MSDTLSVLVVDDAIEHAQMVVELLRSGGAWPQAAYRIAASYEEALAVFNTQPVDVAFVDYWLGARDGLSLLKEARGLGIDVPFVILTGRGAEEVAVEAMKAGAADYISKANLSPDVLERAMRYALALSAEQRQRKDAEAALRANEERFRALVEHSNDVLMLLDAEGRVGYTTPTSQRFFGWPPDYTVRRSIFELVHPDDMDLVTARLGELLRTPGGQVSAEVRYRHADGSWRVMEGIGANRLDDPVVRAIVVNARDVSDRRRLEEQLRQSQKMEAIGQLAGGVAHDFNNLLTAILGYCNLILEDVPQDAAIRQDLEEIRVAGERAASLTRQLLAFSRRQMLQPQTIDVNDLIQQLEKMLRRLISEDVELAIRLADTMPVRVDPASIEQVLVNLAVNARDAMPTGGRLTIETANVELDEAYGLAHSVVVPGRYVMVAVSDTGQGMDVATRARIFEPFFTTKEQGRGSGLGLATVYGIVKQSGGYIWVYSEPGHGTTFKVYLPPADSAEARRHAESGAVTEIQRGWETVLLVEDEDAVRALAREVLRRHGYTVLEARHGLDALRVAERHPDSIHLMITDVVMPHMSGRDLADRLVAARHDLKVLFMSGYTDHAVVHRDLTPGTAFLQKPFTPDMFARKVRHILDM